MTEERKEQRQWLEDVLKECTSPSGITRELQWLQQKFDAIGIQCGLTRKSDVDRLIFQKMTGMPPKKDSEILKIRYWRTGRHKPQSRQQCIDLARALNLDQNETCYLLQYYYDAADQIFSEADAANPVYQTRLKLMQELEAQYLMNASPESLDRIGIPWKNPLPYLRHFYFWDATHYLSGVSSKGMENHLNSINFVHEFQRIRRLLGEVSRKTILRHLFLMGAPYLSVSVMNERLTALGYAPLTEDHESRWGERLDCLILRLLERYDNICTGKTPDEGLAWLWQTCHAIDEALTDTGYTGLQFLRFKSLKNKC